MWLNVVWYVLFVLIISGYLILDGFDMGVGILHLFLAKNDEERRIPLNSIGPVWDGNEVWLVLGGGALFAAFPLVYASLFSGFYVGHDAGAAGADPAHRRHRVSQQAPGAGWRTLWDCVFSVASVGIALLLGVAFGNIMAGCRSTRRRQHQYEPDCLANAFRPAGRRDDHLHAGHARRDLSEHEDRGRAAGPRASAGSRG